jgi:hypothetical protein
MIGRLPGSHDFPKTIYISGIITTHKMKQSIAAGYFRNGMPINRSGQGPYLSTHDTFIPGNRRLLHVTEIADVFTHTGAR